MLVVNGQNFNAAVQVGSRTGIIADFISASVGGRTCITYAGTTEGACALGWNGPDIANGSVSLSSDATLRPAVFDAAFCLPTLDLGTDHTEWIACPFVSNSGNSGGIYPYLQVTVTGGAASLAMSWLWSGVTYTVALGTVTQGTTFYRVLLHIYRDKIKAWLDGVAASDLSLAGSANDTLFPHTCTLYWRTPTSSLAAWDYLRFGVETVCYSATLGQSETNGHPDDGTLYLISKAALEAAIAAGTAYALPIADGAFTESAAATDYLASKVLSGNTGGQAVKLNKTGSNWAKSDW